MTNARERIETLVDEGSLYYIEKNQSAVLVATAKIAEKPAVVAAFDPTKKGGALGYFEGRSLVRAVALAKEGGAPLVILCQSAGADMSEGQLSLSAAGSVFRALHDLDTPKLYLSYGPCIGAAAYMAELCDMVFAVNGQSALCLTGPKIVAKAIYEETNLQAMGGAEAGAKRGLVHFPSETEEEMAEQCRRIMAFLRQKQGTPTGSLPMGDEVSMEALIEGIVDESSAISFWNEWAPSATTLFARIKGVRVGIFANNPSVAAGVLDKEAAEKAAAFYTLAERFHLPVISLADTPGFLPGTQSEAEDVLGGGQRMMDAYLHHRGKKATVAAGNVLGGAYMAMGCKEMGADAYFALERASIGVMGAELAMNILHLKNKNASSYKAMHLSAEAAEKSGLVDAVLRPADLREKLWEVLS